jgi:hypothetical protein
MSTWKKNEDKKPSKAKEIKSALVNVESHLEELLKQELETLAGLLEQRRLIEEGGAVTQKGG